MTSPLQQTFETLAKSRNEAALPTLISALGNADRTIHDQAMLALIKRRSKVGHLAIIEQWAGLTPDQRKALQAGRGRMNGALRDAIVSDDTQLFTSGCEMVEQFTEFDLIASLITVSENKSSPHADEAVGVISRLIDRLSAMVRSPRDYKDRRDPSRIQKYILESLHRSIERYRQHKRDELIEAFVTLSGDSSSHLQSIVDSPHHACFQTVINTLAGSSNPSVHKLLIDFLSVPGVPQVVMQVIGRRTDAAFIARLLEQVDRGFSEKIRKNLKRIQYLAWLNPKQSNIVIDFPEEDQRRAVILVSATGVERDTLLDLYEDVLLQGTDPGRLAVCEALANFQGDRPNRLVYGAINDPSPSVQAEVVRQVRDRHIPGSMTQLVSLLDSPHEEVREAARESLSEFSFESYRTRFESLTDDVRRSTGVLVRKVDQETVPQLITELQSPSRVHRLRAIAIAEALDLVPQVASELIECLQFKDHLVRASIAEALHGCARPDVLVALEELQQDPSAAVRNAARSSMDNITRMQAANRTVEGSNMGQDLPKEVTR